LDFYFVILTKVYKFDGNGLESIGSSLLPHQFAHDPHEFAQCEFDVVIGIVREVLNGWNDNTVDFFYTDLAYPFTHAFECLCAYIGFGIPQ